MTLTLYDIVWLVLFVALIAPLIPTRRRARGIAHFPVVTMCLLLLNIVCFIGSLSDGMPSLPILQQWGLTPREVSFLSLITHAFLHGSWFHLSVNTLGLWLFGPYVEEALGRWEYLLFYLGCGIAGGLLHVALALTMAYGVAGTPLVGASGAIFGLLGLFAVRYWRDKVRVLLFFSGSAIWAVSAFALIHLLMGLPTLLGGATGKVAFWAHVGGFAFGALMAIPLRMREDSAHEYGREDAQKAAAEGRDDVAAAHYREILKTRPHDAEAHHALAAAYVNLRQGEAAHRHTREALRIFLESNQFVAVARVYEDALHNFETFPLPAYLLQRVAGACEETEHFHLAVHALSELCREYPDTKEAEVGLLRLGRIHLQKLNQPHNAEGIFNEFLRLHPDSEWRSHALRLREEARNGGRTTRFPLPELRK